MNLNLDSRLHEENDAVKDLLLSIMSLPLLPEEDIQDAYDEIGYNIDPQILRIVKPFVNYFEDSWMGGVRPPSFSMYKNKKGLSEAFLAYESRINFKIGANADIWTFTSNFLLLI